MLNITSRRDYGMQVFLMYLAITFLSHLLGSILKEVVFHRTSFGESCPMQRYFN